MVFGCIVASVDLQQALDCKMIKSSCFMLLALAVFAASAQAELDGSVLTGRCMIPASLGTHSTCESRHACVRADLTSQVESFWQELFDGTSYSPDFLSSLSNMTELQQKLNIPETGL